jgi:hypothetical protein
MNIDIILKKFIQYNDDVDKNILLLKSSFEKSNDFWLKIDSMNLNILSNEKIMSIVADGLQMIDDQDQLMSFSLEDIKSIYQLLVKYYPDNIQYQIDLIEYIHNVLDDTDESKRLVAKAINEIDQKRAMLSAYLNS